MRIVVLADTHVPDFAKKLPTGVVPALRRADLILHAGDVNRAFVLEELAQYAPVHAALGNNDHADVAAWGAKFVVSFDVEGIRIGMVHDSGPRGGREARMRRRFPEAGIVVFGHSHIPMDIVTGDGLRLFNPGSPTWKRRQPFPTYGILTVAGRRIRTRIVEMPP
jgi:putative phosphoesterase